MASKHTSSVPFEPTLCDLECANISDGFGNPAGGEVIGHGLNIKWQDGPTRRFSSERDSDGALKVVYERNGAFVEDVLNAALQRLQFYQNAAGERFACKENDEAVVHVTRALSALIARRTKRINNGTYGTYEVKDGE